MPVTFPPEAFADGRMLSGLGVPDVSGRIGRPAYFTSDPFFAARVSEVSRPETIVPPTEIALDEKPTGSTARAAAQTAPKSPVVASTAAKGMPSTSVRRLCV